MKFIDIDYYSLYGKSLLHKTPPGYKLLWTIGLFSIVVLSNNNNVLAIAYSLILAYIVFSTLPTKFILLLSMYPLIFTILFVVSTNNMSIEFFLLLLLKVLLATTTVVLLFVTTPYNRIFAIIGKFMPNYLLSAFLFSYRSIFILWSVLSDIQTSLYLRGGFSVKNFKRSCQVLGNASGLLFLKSIDTSERIYDAMRLRGYSGKINYFRMKNG